MAGNLITSLLSLGTKLLPSIRASAQASSSSSNSNNSQKGHARAVLEDLERLMRTLKWIKATLYDADEREIIDRSVKFWLKELRKVAYDAEDVLSEYRYEVTRVQVEARKASQASDPQKGKQMELVELPKDRNAIGVKWVYKTKFGPDGSVLKYKARLVAKGYAQKQGINYEETLPKKDQQLHNLGISNSIISWNSKKQSTVALSTAEAEYNAMTSAACQGVWLRRLLEELDCEQKGATILYCDNQSTIAISNNPVHHNRTKHIDTRLHFIRDMIEQKMIELQYVNTNQQVADVLTKSLPREKFTWCRDMMNVLDFGLRGGVENNPSQK